MTLEDAAQSVDVAGVDFFECYLAAYYHLDAEYCGGLGVGEVVDHDHIVAGLDESHCCMCTDISGTAGDENSFFHILLWGVRL